ncbi:MULTISPECIES: hypothetical protein [Pseudomonas]|uniref:Secreted protein n=1 Tax=Pseudomonas knackmussii TaxID=65741 RepID=A0ABY4KVQ5_9PSED|nr:MULTISPECIES: hypothetical protein [Pseudomonas]UPQ84978.1 hypothetical protein M0M42_08975 [Pseudomonas knackmussii]
MRLAYLAPAVLGLFLVGCGPDEPDDVDPPPATTEQPQAPVTPPVGTTPPASNGAGGDVEPTR